MTDELLLLNSLKKTKSRRLILEILENAPLPMTAEAVHAATRDSLRTSISTTYRTLATLSERGIILKNLSLDGKTYYQLKGHRHKHYLICTACNHVLVIENCPLEEWENWLSEETGYIITGHNLEVSGLCPACAQKMK